MGPKKSTGEIRVRDIQEFYAVISGFFKRAGRCTIEKPTHQPEAIMSHWNIKSCGKSGIRRVESKLKFSI
jgi:hypothetical protein